MVSTLWRALEQLYSVWQSLRSSLLWSYIFFCGFFLMAAFVLGALIIRESHEILEQRKAKRKGAQPWHLPTYPRGWH